MAVRAILTRSRGIVGVNVGSDSQPFGPCARARATARTAYPSGRRPIVPLLLRSRWNKWDGPFFFWRLVRSITPSLARSGLPDAAAH